MRTYTCSKPMQQSGGSDSETRSGEALHFCQRLHIDRRSRIRPCPASSDCPGLSCRASSGASKSVVTQQGRPVGRQRVKNGQALMPTLKYLFRLAGPKILTLLALAIAKTVLSNRLARLQACFLLC